MTLRCYQGDITKIENIDVLVCPANSYGYMDHGLARSIAISAGTSDKHNGTNILDLVREQVERVGHFKVGDVFETDAGLLKRRNVKIIYHAVLIKYINDFCSYQTVDKMLEKILYRALSSRIESIAISGLGCGMGNLDKQITAKIMRNKLDGFANTFDIHVIDKSMDFVKSFNS